jgi:hypothetical protein
MSKIIKNNKKLIMKTIKNRKNESNGVNSVPPHNNIELALSDFISNNISEKFVAYDIINNKKTNILKTNSKLDRPNDFLKFVIDQGGRDYLAIEFNLKDTNIAMIDFDADYHTLEWIHENYPFLNDHKPFPGNTKGYHFFIKNDINLNLKKSINVDDKKIDYITEIIWIKPPQYKEYKDYVPKFLDEQNIKKISDSILKNKMSSLVDKLPEEINQKIISYNNQEVAEILEIIDISRSENGDSWSKIIASLKSLDLYDLALKFSSKCPEKHTDLEFDTKYKTSNKLHIGIVYNYARLDNREEYFQIIRKYKFKNLHFIIDDFESTDKVSRKIAPFLEKNLKYFNKKWYKCDSNNIWVVQDNCYDIIIDTISSGIVNSKKKFIEEIEKNLNDKDKVKFLEQQEIKLISKRREYDSKGKLSLVENYLQGILKEENFHHKLDSSPYKIVFKNGIFDLQTREFKEFISQDDFVSKTLPYDYNLDLINQSTCDKIAEDIDKLFTSDHEKDYVLTFIAYCLMGIPEKHQVFRYHYGKAGNGKTELMKLLDAVFPIYINKVDSTMFKKGAGRKHKFLELFQYYRLLYTEEMPDGPLDPELIKEICDGGSMNTELLYGTSIEYKINGKIIMNSNNLLNADRIDGGLARRLQIVKFKNRFCNNQKEIEFELKTGAVKAYLVDPDMRNRWINNPMCILDIINKYAKSYFSHGLGEAPKQFLEDKQMIIETNNQFETWLLDNIEVGGDYFESKTNIITRYKVNTGQNITDKSLLNIMKDLPYKYDKAKRKNYNKGCYIGFELKKEDIVEEPKNEDVVKETKKKEDVVLEFINDDDELDL